MKFKAKIRKFLAVTLLVAMTVNLAPFSALASEAEQNSAEAVTEQETDGSSVQKEEASSEASVQEESMQPEEAAEQETADEEKSEEAEMPASEEKDSEKETARDVAANDGSSTKEAENDVSSEADSGSSSQNEADRNANDGSEANEVKKNNFLRSAGSGNTIDISDLKSKTYKDGTYEGTTECFVEDEDISYTLKVTVTVSGGKITEIVPEITEDNSSRADQRQNKSCLSDASEGYGDYEGIPTQIIAKDDAVDIVSEATYSSRSIVEAVRIALQDAEAEEAVVNKDELKALVESAAALIESEYTEESWKAFKSALTAATQVLNNDKASQEEVDAQVKALTEAQKALVKKPQEGYVLMNIPYGEFFAAEGVSGVDAVTSATVKTYNQNMAGGSYHDGDGGEILGVTYPVYVKDFTVLEGLTQVKDDTTAVITVAAGKSATTTKEVSGKDVLFASGDYAYYVMSGKPANFKTLSGTAGNFSFSAVENGAESRTMTSAEMIYTGHHTQLQLNVDADGLADGVLTGVLLTADGETYALRHVVEVWKRVELGWNWDELDGNGLSGKTITNLTYYLQDGGVYSYDVNITVKKNPGEAEAVFEDEDTLKVTGLPEDMKGAKAKVQTKVGRGQAPVVLAEDVKVEADGSIGLPEAAVLNQAYTILITSDNYADQSLEATCLAGYVLMNIPYGEFFAAEGVSGVDAVTSATVKTYNQNMAGGSYHDGDGGEILGVTYPVYVKDFTVLEGFTQVKDDTTAVITVAAGKSATTTKEVSGKDVLFASGDYAYYVLSEKPANFKTLSGTAGNFSFSAVENGAESRTMTSAEMIYTGHHTQLQLNVDADGLADGVLTGVLLTADGETYALRHVVEVWKRVELGWNWDELDGNGLSGKTITNLTYYLQDGGVYSYDVNITVKKNPGEAEAVFEDEDTIKVTGLPEDMKGAKAKVQTKVGRGETPVVLAEEKEVGADGSIELPKAAVLNQAYTILITSDDYADLSLEATCLAGYVLMNIPYGEFYAAEGTSDVDAVSSATRNKPRTIGLAGGSYHVNADGSDITGVIYPVHVKDITALADCTQITDESTVSITVTNRGQTSTTEFTGKEALFEAPSYAYYILTEKPALYKELNAADGAFSFGSVNAEAGTVTGATGEVNTAGRHTNIEIALEGLAGISSGTIVSGVILTDDSGNLYGLRHVYNIWRGTELGWNEGEYDLAGKTIKNIRYYTQESVTDYPVEIYIPINTGITVTVEDGLVSDGKTKVTLSDALPDDFNAQYTVENLKDAKGSETELTYSTDAAIGKYELVISDNSGKYAEIKTSFTIYTNEIPAIVGESTTEPALAVNKEGGASDEEFADYLEKISKVTIGGKEYPAKDSRNVKAVPIINTDPEKGEAGAIDLNAKDANGDYIFPGDGEYVLTAEAEGYADADFKITVTAPEIIEGDGTKWTTDSTEGFDIVSDAPFKWFREAVLDGEKMEEPAISEGSTHVTLSADLLGTLTTGDHTLSIVSGNGTATATFTVAEPESKVEPQDDVKKDDVKKDDSKKDGTSSKSSSSASSGGSKSGTSSSKNKSGNTGDESNLLLWLLLIALSGAALAGAVYRRRIGEK